MTTTISDEQVLLPCPFCGELPRITKHFREDIYGLVHRCKFAGPIVFEHADKNLHIRHWNTRAPDPRVAELETALSDLLSWFPDKPDHSWRIKAGAPGADAAIAKARALVAAMENDND